MDVRRSRKLVARPWPRDPARPTIDGHTRTGALIVTLIILIAAALATIIAAAAAANAEPGGLSGPMPLDV